MKIFGGKYILYYLCRQKYIAIMGTIIGRQKEITLLSDYITSDKAEFVVVYGRRRIGKTFLVKQFFDEKFTFYLSGAENANKKQQLFNFATALNQYSNGDYPLVDSWQAAFVQLENYLQSLKNRKTILL
jgi:AAA+ ATPase superfamily predicted ATPase